MTAVWPGYFADPFVLRLPGGGYVAYGSGPPATSGPDGPRVFECLTSPDLTHWETAGYVLNRLPPTAGDQYWAPEVVQRDGVWWLYYSVGHGIDGHQLRVARADSPLGPFTDTGTDLTPDETFAIDAHPFSDVDGRWYLYLAHDVLDHPRPGTHLAVAPLDEPSRIGEIIPVLAPNADWQIYQRDRAMYGRQYDWHTLEGPSVVRRHGRYWMTYSGGAWTGPGYATSWAAAPHPLGPWNHAPPGSPPLLATDGELIGPGHNSLTLAPSGEDLIAFHSWDSARANRRMHIARITFEADRPRVLDPLGDGL
ncbi:MAG: glycoside hydrolase family 43 protein [Propionicimonas sp.]